MTDISPAASTISQAAIEDTDLTPDGLEGAPAHEQDQDSIVHTGNS